MEHLPGAASNMRSSATFRVSSQDPAAVLARLHRQMIPAASFELRELHRYRIRETTPSGWLVARPGKDPLVLRVTIEPAAAGCRVILQMSRSWLVPVLLGCFTGLLGFWFVVIAVVQRAPVAVLGALPFVACGIAMLRLPARFRRECQEETAFLRACLGADP
jgi:hypothetical protein